ncbi:52 kDa repressor of the inhibitor of the protein kinase-like isoform X1 [Diabrotica virgifera virgifera]|uniref:52 kDa repressor of the inhibitor of the protein kinase-like isoform X1 n=1 Tax=Diabrotica virgifera virgifera TaxID=50390 RepID=A0A6P7FCT2_DIAVI|nr:52 kDa repressor of the inhibitor of the protein kinase-like isoform X1 [Diabrotica virgifera virgifera]
MASRGGTKCAYFNCSSKTGQGISLFCFPKDQQRIEMWLRACNREDLLDKSCEALSKNFKLCEKHFAEPCFVGTGKKRKHIMSDAVPTLFAHIDDDKEPIRKHIILRGKHSGNM